MDLSINTLTSVKQNTIWRDLTSTKSHNRVTINPPTYTSASSCRSSPRSALWTCRCWGPSAPAVCPRERGPCVSGSSEDRTSPPTHRWGPGSRCETTCVCLPHDVPSLVRFSHKKGLASVNGDCGMRMILLNGNGHISTFWDSQWEWNTHRHLAEFWHWLPSFWIWVYVPHLALIWRYQKVSALIIEIYFLGLMNKFHWYFFEILFVDLRRCDIDNGFEGFYFRTLSILTSNFEENAKKKNNN